MNCKTCGKFYANNKSMYCNEKCMNKYHGLRLIKNLSDIYYSYRASKIPFNYYPIVSNVIRGSKREFHCDKCKINIEKQRTLLSLMGLESTL